MYFASNSNMDSIDTYVAFLRDIVESKNDTYKSIIEEVVSEAIKLNVTKDFYTINRERFGIITLLAEKLDVLQDADPSNLSKDDYSKLLKIVEDVNVTLI